MGFDEEMIEASTAFFETQNQEILDARNTFSQLKEKYKELLAPNAQAV